MKNGKKTRADDLDQTKEQTTLCTIFSRVILRKHFTSTGRQMMLTALKIRNSIHSTHLPKTDMLSSLTVFALWDV